MRPRVWMERQWVYRYSEDPWTMPDVGGVDVFHMARHASELLIEALEKDGNPPEETEALFGICMYDPPAAPAPESHMSILGRLVRDIWQHLHRCQLVSAESISKDPTP